MEELEIMRLQLNELRNHLNSQQIINNDLLKKLIRRNASWLNNLLVIEIVTIPLCYLLFAIVSATVNISQWYALTFLLLAIPDVIIDFRTIRIPFRLLNQATPIQLTKYLIRQKKERFIQTVVALPLGIVWVVAFSIALFTSSEIPLSGSDLYAAKIGGITAGIIGSIIATIVVIILYRKLQNTNDNLIKDLHDLNPEL